MSRAVNLRIGAFSSSRRLSSSASNGSKDKPSVVQMVAGVVRRVWYGDQIERDTFKRDVDQHEQDTFKKNVVEADKKGLDWNDEATYRQSVGLKAVGEEPSITAAQEQVRPPMTGNIRETTGPESTFKHHALKDCPVIETKPERQVKEEAKEKVETPGDPVLGFRIKKNIY